MQKRQNLLWTIPSSLLKGLAIRTTEPCIVLASCERAMKIFGPCESVNGE